LEAMPIVEVLEAAADENEVLNDSLSSSHGATKIDLPQGEGMEVRKVGEDVGLEHAIRGNVKQEDLSDSLG